MNVSDVLRKAGHYVQGSGSGYWHLTESGQKHVRASVGMPATSESDVSDLQATTGKIFDAEVRDYVDEAISCLKVGARRACIVFTWTGTIRVIRDRLLTFDNDALNTALQKHDPKARRVKSLNDFAYIQDKTTLLAAQELGIFDKSEKDTLEEALNLRNRCGHPGKYQPKEKKVSSFIEDLVSIVFR